MAIAINGAGTITGVSVGGLPDGCIAEADIASGVIPAGGKVLQVLQTVKNDEYTSTATTATAVTGLSVTITPAATTSKILVTISVSGMQTSGANNLFGMLQRDSTPLARGDQVGSNRQRVTFNMNGYGSSQHNNAAYTYLDSPSSTSALVYKHMAWTESGTHYINRNQAHNDNTSESTASSSITVMEIGA